MNTISDPIANRELDGVTLAGNRFRIRIVIGRPFPFTTPDKDWRCEVSIPPLHGRVFAVGGYDSLQAMSLAISFAHQMLIDFCEQKGRLFFPDSDEEAIIGEPFTIRASQAQPSGAANSVQPRLRD